MAALPECVIFSQVELSRVLEVKTDRNKFRKWFNKINGKSLDFVVCLKDSTVVAAVELDDKTHSRAARVKADNSKDEALAAAGVVIVRWNVSSLPDEAAIRNAFIK